MHRLRSSLCILIALLLTDGIAYPQWGTLRGRVEFKGEVPATEVLVKAPFHNLAAGNVILDESLIVDENSMGVANVAVWLTKKPAKIHPAFAKPSEDVMEVQLVNQIIDPRLLIVRTDQKVKFINRDGDVTNVRFKPAKSWAFSQVLSPKGKVGDQKEWTPSKPERLPIQMTSTIHGWMQSHLVIVDHPYATVTDLEGNFEIEGIPAGAHELSIWHERIGWFVGRMGGPTYEVESDEITEIPTITFAADRLIRR